MPTERESVAANPALGLRIGEFEMIFIRLLVCDERAGGLEGRRTDGYRLKHNSHCQVNPIRQVSYHCS